MANLCADFARREFRGVDVRIGGVGRYCVHDGVEVPSLYVLSGNCDYACGPNRARHGTAVRGAGRSSSRTVS